VGSGGKRREGWRLLGLRVRCKVPVMVGMSWVRRLMKGKGKEGMVRM
jgi:hypothetical protein